MPCAGAMRAFSCRAFPWILLIAGCTSSTPEAPTYDVGAIEGKISGGGIGVRASVYFSSAHSQIIASCDTDSDGAYFVSLPSGSYIMEAWKDGSDFYYSSAGPKWNHGGADSIHVGRGIVRADISGGRLSVRLHSSMSIANQVQCWLVEGSSLCAVASPSQSEDGVFTYLISPVPAGDYSLLLSAGGSRLWLPGSYQAAEAEPIHVPPNGGVEYEAQLEEWATLSGRDEPCWMDGSSYEIYAVDADSSVAAHAYGQGDETFSMALLRAAPIRLCVDRGGGRRWIGGADFRGAAVLDLQPQEARDDLDLIESGIECDFDTFVAPGTFIAVTLVGESGRPCVNANYFSAPIRIPNLEPGSYLLELQPDRATGWLPQWVEGADSIAGATPIRISRPGEIAHVTVHLVAGGKILGRVMDRSGNPVFGTYVYFDQSSDSGHQWSAADVTDTDGRFAVVGLPDGDYLVGASIQYDLCWYPGTLDRASAQAISIRDHAVVEGIEWRLP